MSDTNSEGSPPKKRRHHIQRNILAGVLILIPLAITWLFFGLVFRTLSGIGEPWVKALARTIKDDSPALAEFILSPWFQSALAALITLTGLYVLGWATTKVIGRRVIAVFEKLIGQIPLVEKIYSATKKLVSVMGGESLEHTQRVVLINFPSDSLKTVGFVTAVMRDDVTGEQLAAVYVPTTPNPTSGYLEIVPVNELISTNWSFDEAMTFIISGGAVAPEKLTFSHKPSAVTNK